MESSCTSRPPLRSNLTLSRGTLHHPRFRLPYMEPEGFIVWPQSRTTVESHSRRTSTMTRAFTTAALILLLMPAAALAQDHRPGDAALGALSGAVVLGPIGAVAGAVVGYTAGPSIDRSWGLRRSSTARQGGKSARREARVSPDDSQPAPNNQAGPPPAAQAPPRSPKTASTVPPVQGLE